jgi:hypothetical protein
MTLCASSTVRPMLALATRVFDITLVALIFTALT